MKATAPKPSLDVSSLTTPIEVEVLESSALARNTPAEWENTAIAQQLQQVAQTSDPLADALQAHLGRESREAYLKDWRTF